MSRPAILNSNERKSILFLGDIAIVLASLNVFVNHAIDREFISLRVQLTIFAVGTLTFLAYAYILDFYNVQRTSGGRFIVSHSVYITALYVFSTFLFAVLFYDASFWRGPLLVFLLLTPLEIILWRFLISNVFRIIPVVKNVLYLYDEDAEASLRDHIGLINGKDMDTFYRVKLTCRVSDSISFNKKYFLDAIDKVDSWIIDTKNYSNLSSEVKGMLIRSMMEGKEVVSFAAFYENIYEALPIQAGNDNFYEILQLRNKRIRYLQRLFSFGVNLLLSLVTGILFLLAVPFVWVFNLAFNPGPLFYVQQRVGQYGRDFKIYKFRSMVVDAEKEGEQMATKGDKRITPFGRLLRTFRIDELPQILSVIKGDMQFIGPRPERRFFVDTLNEMEPFYNVRHLVKPGITGWAQVKYKYGENLEDSIRKLEYDLYYIKNQSVSLDLKIIFKTITTIIFSRGV